MSNSLTPFVPEKTYAVCTNGTKRGEMVVGHHDNVMKKNTCLFATIQDKPTNFACVYMGILIAVIGALLTALFVSGVGATLGCLLLAALAGCLAAYGLGGVICYFCLRPSPWIGFHPRVIINGEPAIIGTSTIICKPLWFTPGDITLFYSKEVASRVANIHRWNSFRRIFDATSTAYGIPSMLYNAASGFITGGFVDGIASMGKDALKGFIGGTVFDFLKGEAIDGIANLISPPNPNISSEDPKFKAVYEEEEFSLDPKNFITGENIFGWIPTINAARSFKWSNPDRSRVMLWRHRVWGKFYSGKSAPLTAAWKWDKQLGVNKQSSQRALVNLGFSIGSDIALGTVVGVLKNNFRKDLPELENAEAEAISKVGVFEKTI